MEYKSVATEFKADSSKRIIEGYASVFGNVDSYKDIVKQGAFVKTLQENKGRVKVLYQHDTWKPLGKPLSMIEDAYGLLTASYISKTAFGNDVLVWADDGVLNELSIGFDTIKSAQIEDGGRELMELRLWEYSLVTFAANDLATITNVKNSSDLERYIRNLENLAPHGLKAGRVLSKQNLDRLTEALKSIQEILATAEPSEDTPPDAKSNDEPQSHSALTAIYDLKNTLALEKLSQELRSTTAALRGNHV
jgi:uncharacterized protein